MGVQGGIEGGDDFPDSAQDPLVDMVEKIRVAVIEATADIPDVAVLEIIFQGHDLFGGVGMEDLILVQSPKEAGTAEVEGQSENQDRDEP